MRRKLVAQERNLGRIFGFIKVAAHREKAQEEQVCVRHVGLAIRANMRDLATLKCRPSLPDFPVN